MIFSENRCPLFGIMLYWWSMIFSDLPSPAEASGQNNQPCRGLAQAGNRYPLFGIMLEWLPGSKAPLDFCRISPDMRGEPNCKQDQYDDE
jgi:hypothetical protein